MIRALIVAIIAACSHPSPPMPPTEHHWQVYDRDTLVLEVSSRPGPIISTALLPPGTPPATSTFMSATARDAAHEDQLHGILVASRDLDGFLANLRAAGLVVKPVD